jgi:hypothetical protein
MPLTSTSFIIHAINSAKTYKRDIKPPEGFYLIIIYGELRIGKSTYAFKTGVETLQRIYSLSKEEAWNEVKNYIIFHLMNSLTS